MDYNNAYKQIRKYRLFELMNSEYSEHANRIGEENNKLSLGTKCMNL